MPHSMVIAEPIGLIAGVVSGRAGGQLGRVVAEEIGIPSWLGGLVGAATCHYLSAALTKAVVNTALIDPVGGAANVTVTSPLTSVAHGLFDALTDAIPELSGLLEEVAGDGSLLKRVEELLSDALPTTPAEIHTALLEGGADPGTYSSDEINAMAITFATADSTSVPVQPATLDVRFSGFDGVDSLIDDQGPMPTCFPETVENILQLYHGDVAGGSNEWSQQIVERAKSMGWTDSAGRIFNQFHQNVLQDAGIPTELVDFNHQYFKAHLDAQCPIQLGVDSAYFNNPHSGPHSIALVDMQADAAGRWWYRVMDSAHPDHQWYPAEQVEAGANSARVKWGFDGHNGRGLVCKIPAVNWPFRT